MTDLNKEFDAKAAEPQLLDANAYKALLEALLAKGQGAGKTSVVAAYKTQNMRFATLQSDGAGETVKDIVVAPAYITLDTALFPDSEDDVLRKAVVKMAAKNWGDKVVHDRDRSTPDYKAAGVWISDEGKIGVKGFLFDYIPTEPENPNCVLFKPNPEATRVCLDTDKGFKFPANWMNEDGTPATFAVKQRGTVAIRERDVEALVVALRLINEGKVSVEEALYTDKGAARFDVYAMEPGFRANNYGDVALKTVTVAATASLSAKAAKPSGKKLG